MTAAASARPAERSTLRVAAALALGVAVSLGLARFSYALLLPPMRADLGWSYFIGGAMNTVNAGGYLLGALVAPRVLGRVDARAVLLAGSAATALLLAAHGLVLGDGALFALRFGVGVTSAAVFVGGGLLAARLARPQPSATAAPGARRAPSAGLVLGIYYGGAGVGIVVSALLVPAIAARAASHAWQGAWLALGAAALAATALIASHTRHLAAPHAAAARGTPLAWRRFGWALASYFLFGLGYIGYMTFVITLLRERRLGEPTIVAFYVLLGAAVVASSWLWAGLLQRCRGGQALGVLNALLAVATALPVASAHPAAVFASGLLFGGVFLSLVASTTALVRHNLPPDGWPGGIAAFTIVFAAGQIVGPSLTGWVADGPGGLARGFVCSALVLAAASALGWRQKALPYAAQSPTAAH